MVWYGQGNVVQIVLAMLRALAAQAPQITDSSAPWLNWENPFDLTTSPAEQSQLYEWRGMVTKRIVWHYEQVYSPLSQPVRRSRNGHDVLKYL